MVAKYKINERVILTDSGGGRNLFVDGAITFNDSDGKTLTIKNTKKTLAPDFFTEFFHRFQGATSGYATGGTVPPFTNVIDKFPFATDGNATDVGNLTQARTGVAGQSSRVSGYTTAGYATIDIIDKFSFTSDGNASDVGNLTAGRNAVGGNSSSTNGYTTGGSTNGYPIVPSDVIDKFPFSVDANATDVGNLLISRRYPGGQNSKVSGYSAGGGPPSQNIIEKFPFSTDANTTDVGDLLVATWGRSGQSSTTHGYASGGYPLPSAGAVIEKFSFSADGNSTDVGDLTVSKTQSAGQSSIESGYVTGGYDLSNPSPPPTIQTFDIIEKFPFSTDANSTDVGDLTQARYGAGGQQV